ncbi:MAG: response regulator, partial [Planctomycetota bacterium]|nr:response regulator [Planctomycetota bacterium]
AHLCLKTDLTRQQRGYLRKIQGASQSLLGIINDILDFSKIEAGKLAIDRVGFHLRSCLRDVVASLSAEARKRALRLEWEVDPAVPDALVGDPGRLRQILVNLLGNALRFTETGSVSVGVEVSAEDESCVTVHFRVTDTGIGIPESKQAEIFQAFSQVDTSTTRKYGGTGLGLSISSELVSLLGGDIWLDSRPGEGSTFHFTARFGRADPVRREPTSDVPSLRGLRALVVGRGPAGGPSPARLLERWDLDTAEVPDGDEAIRRLEESRAGGQPFDVTVCESDLASVDGFELARAVQATPGLTRAFVLVTSAGQRGDAERSRELGIAAYLARPFEPEDLFEAIVAALESSPEASPLVTRHLLRERRRRLKVLLAEDNELAIELAVTLLERWGHSVVVVRTGRAAVDALEEGRFDLVLMDMEMPEMGGVEATRTIRQREERRERRDGRTPILAMTANAFEEDADACLEAGMDGVLCKPVRPVDLERAIEDVAGRVEPPSSSGGEPAGAGDALPADLEAARQALGTYAPTLPRLLAVALGEIPKQLRRLRAAVESRDPEAVRRTAHSLKGTGAQFFAARVVERAADLEAMGRDGRLDGAPGKFRELAEELERFETYVTEKLGK